MEICRVYFWTLNHARPLHWSLASWRDISGRVTHEITGRAPATPAEGYLVFCFLFFFAASSNTRLRSGLKTSHESRAQTFYSGGLGSRCIRCEAPVAPRGGAAHSAAQVVIKLEHGDVRGQLARKKKKTAPDWDPPSVCDGSIFLGLIETALGKQSGAGPWLCSRGGKLIGALLYVLAHINAPMLFFFFSFSKRCQSHSWTLGNRPLSFNFDFKLAHFYTKGQK